MLGGNSRDRTHTRHVLGGTAAACAAVAVLGLTAVPAAADGQPDLSPEQWGLQALGARELWEETQGQGITVALPGIAVYEDHPDLVDNVTVDTQFGEDGDRDEGSGAAALVAGHGHGMDADGGVLGVAPASELLVLPTGNELPAAIRFAAEEGAQVILLPETDASVDLTGATQDAVRNGALVVGPAGGRDDANVLTVAGTAESGELIPGSPEAAGVGLTAPGADLETAGPDMGQVQVTGTPYAAAMAAGAAALLRADFPQLRPEQVREALVEGAQQGPGGLPALHLPSAQTQAAGIAQDIPLIDEELVNEGEESGGVPVWAWFVTVGAVVVLGVVLLVVWIRRSTADPYGVEAERREEDEQIAAERAAEAGPASRRKPRGGRRRKTRGD
ncbi:MULTISPECIES: S8 family serine peptidase [Nocardiopsidaceae]|uniref:S8 family serine peptidase n=1 Tax=Streptomonospora nanhaiensis TaxID=1323731 RepID=A0ABY6YQL3_9ACTN|nr:S8 family serine peptidase [Streptomonospora nanhaiensis]WAE74135.1 S8 family serine peptidase [Streptomonospora nanhaiensis]